MFKDRHEAGRMLLKKLGMYRGGEDVIILGLPRGGVVLASEISSGLGVSMDVIVPRKIGAPGNPELAIGAIAEEGEGIFDIETIASMKVTKEYLDEQKEVANKEALRRLNLYRKGRRPLNLQGKTAILVDDGIATGSTMRAAIQAARFKGAKKIIVAVPVVAQDALRRIRQEVDGVVYLDAPSSFFSIGQFYKKFDQVEDKEVIGLMKIKSQTTPLQEKSIFSTGSNPNLTQSIAKLAGISIGEISLSEFSDKEISLQIHESVEGKFTFVLGSGFPPAENILKFLMVINLLRVNKADRITALIPYFGYGRSDHQYVSGAPINARLMARLISCAGADRVVTIDLHSTRIESFFTIPILHLSAIPLLAGYVRDMNLDNLIVVSPDEGGVARARFFATELGMEEVVIIAKKRADDESVEARLVEGDVEGKNVVIVDDMIQSGATVIKAAEILKSHGAQNIYIAVTHLISTGPGAMRVAEDKHIKHTIVTNTIPLPNERKIQKKFSVVSVDKLIAGSIGRSIVD